MIRGSLIDCVESNVALFSFVVLFFFDGAF